MNENGLSDLALKILNAIRELREALIHERLPAYGRTSTGERFKIPSAFWTDITPEQLAIMMGPVLGAPSRLDPMNSLRLWQMLGRSDPCPADIEFALKEKDIMRIWPERYPGEAEDFKASFKRNR